MDNSQNQDITQELVKKFKRRSYIREYMTKYDLKEICFSRNDENYGLTIKTKNDEQTLNFTYNKRKLKQEKDFEYQKRRDSGYESDTYNGNINKEGIKTSIELYPCENIINESNIIIDRIHDYFDGKILFDN